jgi:hypothetical protein
MLLNGTDFYGEIACGSAPGEYSAGNPKVSVYGSPTVTETTENKRNPYRRSFKVQFLSTSGG